MTKYTTAPSVGVRAPALDFEDIKSVGAFNGTPKSELAGRCLLQFGCHTAADRLKMQREYKCSVAVVL